ncbi:MAG: hypothetical protein IPM24_05605 [Bryobacterales bacterium]|nr:hypothetical protein [Bryobacterales bacterium]
MPDDPCAQIEQAAAAAECVLLERNPPRTPGQRLDRSAEALERVASGLAAIRDRLEAGAEAGLDRAALVVLRRRLERIGLLVRQTVEFHAGIATVGLGGGEPEYTAGGARAAGSPGRRFSLEG